MRGIFAHTALLLWADTARSCRNCWRTPRRVPRKCTRTRVRVRKRRVADLSYQDKKVTIVHGGDKLLNEAYPDKFRKSVESQLRARKIDLVLGEYADQFPPSGSGELVFRSGGKINAGLVVSNCFTVGNHDR